jgi:hypothetical protein
VFLTGERSRPAGSVVQLPEGSVVTVRVAVRFDISVSSSDAAGETEVAAVASADVAPAAAPAESAAPTEYRITLATWAWWR